MARVLEFKPISSVVFDDRANGNKNNDSDVMLVIRVSTEDDRNEDNINAVDFFMSNLEAQYIADQLHAAVANNKIHTVQNNILNQMGASLS